MGKKKSSSKKTVDGGDVEETKPAAAAAAAAATAAATSTAGAGAGAASSAAKSPKGPKKDKPKAPSCECEPDRTSSAASAPKLGQGYPTPGPQSPVGAQVMDHVFFLSNEEWKNAREQNPYDLIVIGSGFCCLAVVARALENNPNCRILIIERGTFFLPEHFQNLPLPFVSTLGGLSETFPWTVTQSTANKEDGPVTWQHGMVPFFGGRSTLWSAWCPRPNEQEMDGWPKETIAKAKEYFPVAEKLLRVRGTDPQKPGSNSSTGAQITGKPVYGALQTLVKDSIQTKVKNAPLVYRVESAPLACDGTEMDGVDFQKFSTPGSLLELVLKQRELAKKCKGAPLHIVTGCVVERILQQESSDESDDPKKPASFTATALQTSRGVLALGKAKLVLAMGTLPPVTLVRNAFPHLKDKIQRFSAHFITSVVACVDKADLDTDNKVQDLELAACYVAGTALGKDGKPNYKQQFHIQLSALYDKDPEKSQGTALRYMPDVVATATLEQLTSAKGKVVFVCAVLGELDYSNKKTWYRANPADSDPTTNSLLRVSINETDHGTWDAMDESTFDVLEKTLSPKGPGRVKYWHPVDQDDKEPWKSTRPTKDQRRVNALVHESSPLFIGKPESGAPVGLDYRLHQVTNVYITGGCLWPQGGSWNPTMTMCALATDLADRLVPKKK